MRSIVIIVVIGTALAFGVRALQEKPAGSSGKGVALVDVFVPELPGIAAQGESAFNLKCASCHGENAAGQQGVAPPLIHKIYEPGHHGDMSFVLAAKQGVRQHHWRFGDMPPVQGITDADISAIIAYVRTLQRANGIN